MNKYIIFALAAYAVSMSPVTAAEPVADSNASELAAVQAKTYDDAIATTFTATISTMQSLGYLNINANRESGTITGETESKGVMIYNILWGVGKKKRTQLASLFLEQTAPTKTLIKLNLTINEAKTRGLFGTAFKDGVLIRQADPYQLFYQALSIEMARRLAAMPIVSPVSPVSSASPPARQNSQATTAPAEVLLKVSDPK